MKPRITHITLSGGGVSGIAYIGCIRFLQMEDMTATIRHVSGTSIGAFFAAAIALDIPYKRLEESLRAFCTFKHKFSTAQILAMFSNLGIDDGAFSIEVLKTYICDELNSPDGDITFMDLAKRTGKHLVVCANCVETMTPTYFSVDTTPNIGILEAVQASMSVPIFFRPKRIGELHYSDGATCDNTPTSCFPEASGLSSHLAFVLANESANIPPGEAMRSFVSYILSHFQTYVTNCAKKNDKLPKWTIALDKCPCSFLPLKYHKEGITLSISNEDFETSIAYGYAAMHDWFTQIDLDNPS